MGLAFRSLNTITPEPQCTFMECLQQSLPEPVFTTSLSLAGGGFLDFGFIDDTAYTGNFTKIPVDNTTGFWQVNDVQIGSGGKTFSGNPGDAVFDTDSTFLYLPQAAVSAYTDLVKGAKYDNTSGGYVFPCNSQLPDLELAFTQATSGPATAIIRGDYLKYGPLSVSGPDCLLSMGADTGIGFSLLGMPFFANRYIVWNQSEPSVSFANATGHGTTTPPASTTKSAASHTSTGAGHNQPATVMSSSLSTGAKAGIGVGVAVAGLMLIAFGIWGFQRRKKRPPESGATTAEGNYTGKPELEGRGLQRSELRGDSISEMPEKRPELASDVRHELQGDEFARELPSTVRAESPR